MEKLTFDRGCGFAVDPQDNKSLGFGSRAMKPDPDFDKVCIFLPVNLELRKVHMTSTCVTYTKRESGIKAL